jgi:hypothetical protein
MSDSFIDEPNNNQESEKPVLNKTQNEDPELLKVKKHKLSEPVFSKAKPENETPETVPGPSDYTVNIPIRLKGIEPPNNEKIRQWAEILSAGSLNVSFNGQFIKSLDQSDSEFKQNVSTDAGSIGIEPAKMRHISNQTIDGEKAIMAVRNMLGLGNYVRVPLFHSGFWVTLKAPSEGEILELHRQITQDKIELGRSTYGLAFGNTVVFFVNRLFEFALNNIHSHTVKTDKNIRELIYAHDVPVLIWGIACAIWPNGFNYSRACIANADECNHILTETLNLTKLLWTNNKALNEWQKNHMFSKGTASMSLDDVQRYRKELLNNQLKEVVINPKSDSGAELKIKLRTPTAQEWVEQGTNWINQIADSIAASISQTTNISERNSYMLDVAKSSALRQYSHWVESMEIDTNSIVDRETIEKVIGTISSDDSIRSVFLESIKNYIDDSVVSLIGIPAYNCPNCGQPQESEHDKLNNFVNIIPLDVYNTFFIPIVQRVLKIQAR